MHSDWMSRYTLLMFNELDSTNLEAKKLASSAPIGNFVIWAKSQTAGRGRSGRLWESKSGNLYMSILLSPAASVEDQAQISFVAALSVLEAITDLFPNSFMVEDLKENRSLEPECTLVHEDSSLAATHKSSAEMSLERSLMPKSDSADIKLKWPNDVLVDGKKISGILPESTKVDSKNYLIVGIGINLAHHPDIKEKPTTSMKASGMAYDSVEQVLNLVMNAFEKYYNIWHEGYGFAKIRGLWLARAYRFKETITVSDGKQRISGVFEDLDQSGSIVLRLASGEACIMSACEVFFGADSKT